MKPIYWLILLAFLLRTITLDQSLWLDEAINLIAARDRGVIDLVTNYSLADFHPPFYHLVLHYWLALAGDSEVVARFPSVVFGLITIYFTYLIGQRLFKNQSISLHNLKIPLRYLPSIFLATSGLHIYYSGEARMYSLAAMFATSAIYFLLRHKHATSPLSAKPRPLINPIVLGLVLSLVGMLYTDYLTWFLLPLFMLIAPLPTTIAALSTLPWLPFLYRQLTLGLNLSTQFPAWKAIVGGFSIKNIALIPVKFLIGRVSLDNKFHYALALTLPIASAATFLASAFRKLSTSQPGLRIILAWFILAPGLAILVSPWIAVLSYFRLLFILPAFYLALVLGLKSLPKKLVQPALVILVATNLISSSAYLFMPRFHREDWRGLKAFIDSYDTPTAITVFPSLSQSAPYQYYQSDVPAIDQVDFDTFPETVFLLRYVQDIFDPTDSQKTTLEETGYIFVEARDFNGVVVWVYQRPSRLYASLTH